MITAIILGVLAGAGIVATIVSLRTDGYRQVPTEWTRAGVWEHSTRRAAQATANAVRKGSAVV